MKRTNIAFRPLIKADLPRAHELRRLASWNQSQQDWAGYLEFEPQGCFAAEIDGLVVGTATTITYGRSFGWIGMVLVDPEYRRGGVGTALLLRAIEYLKSRGVEGIKLDATPMGRPVYLPLGFRDEYPLARYEGIAASLPVTDATGISHLTEGNLEEVSGFDAGIFGANRAAVLGSLARRNPELCFVSRGPEGINGYLIARQGSNAMQIGPWLAREPAVAERLLDPVFALMAGRRTFIDVPEPNQAGRELMARLQFKVQRGYMRMYLGSNQHPGNPAQIFSTSGAEKG